MMMDERLTDEEIEACRDAGDRAYMRHRWSIRGQQITPQDSPDWHFASAIESAVLARAAVPAVQLQEPTINYAILQAWAETWNIDYNGLCRTVRAAVAAPLDAATARDAARYRWLTDDHADPATREKCRELLYRMPVMSYAAASNAIDIAMQEGAEE